MMRSLPSFIPLLLVFSRRWCCRHSRSICIRRGFSGRADGEYWRRISKVVSLVLNYNLVVTLRGKNQRATLTGVQPKRELELANINERRVELMRNGRPLLLGWLLGKHKLQNCELSVGVTDDGDEKTAGCIATVGAMSTLQFVGIKFERTMNFCHTS